jgi:ATP-dependent DNA ligase
MSKKTPTPQERQESKDIIRFYIYDGWGFPYDQTLVHTTDEDDYLLRKTAINNAFFARCFKARYKDIVGWVPTWTCHSEAEVHDIFLKCLADKQEGVIVRIMGVGYECKRTWYLLKYKPENDDEYRIVAVNEGVGKFAGRVATFTCEKLDKTPFKDGETTFNATFKGSDPEAVKAWTSGAAHQMVGKVATIIFIGLTAYGKPNHARLDWHNWNKKN